LIKNKNEIKNDPINENPSLGIGADINHKMITNVENRSGNKFKLKISLLIGFNPKKRKVTR